MSWVPQPDGSTLCEEHGETFRAPVACSKCGPADAAIEVVDHECEVMDERARAMGLGDELADERAFESMYRQYRRWSKLAHDGVVRRGDDGGVIDRADPNHRAAADYAGLAIRALRAKAELTLRRRDWLRYFQAERDKLATKHGTPGASQPRDTILDASVGREVPN